VMALHDARGAGPSLAAGPASGRKMSPSGAAPHRRLVKADNSGLCLHYTTARKKVEPSTIVRVVFCVLATLTRNSEAQSSAASDKAALLAIRAVANNKAHPIMSTWNEATGPCDAAGSTDNWMNAWKGVQCNRQFGRVVGFSPGSLEPGNSGDSGVVLQLDLLAPLTELRYLSLEGQSKATGDLAALVQLQLLEQLSLQRTSVFGQVSSLANLPQLRSLQIGNTYASGPVGALRTLAHLPGNWGGIACYNNGKGNCCCCSDHNGAKTDQCFTGPEGPFDTLDHFPEFTPCTNYGFCGDAGLALVPNASQIAGVDECACCVGSTLRRDTANGRCSSCAAQGEQLYHAADTHNSFVMGTVKESCVRCPQIERCVAGVCVDNSAGRGCVDCAVGYFSAGRTCHECPESGAEYLQLALALGGTAVIWLALWSVSGVHTDMVEDVQEGAVAGREAAQSLARISNSAIVLSISIPSLFQITLTFTLPNIPIPDVLKACGTWIASIVSFDLGVVGTPECVVRQASGDFGQAVFIFKILLTVRTWVKSSCITFALV
jgi:hypothetical protein